MSSSGMLCLHYQRHQASAWGVISRGIVRRMSSNLFILNAVVDRPLAIAKGLLEAENWPGDCGANEAVSELALATVTYSSLQKRCRGLAECSLRSKNRRMPFWDYINGDSSILASMRLGLRFVAQLQASKSRLLSNMYPLLSLTRYARLVGVTFSHAYG